MAIKKSKLVLAVILLVLLSTLTLAATRVFYVQETEFVKINAEAIDQDHDLVEYTYSEPLDEFGEWQTTYGDAGEYEIDVIASDGINQSTKQIKLIVEKKNRAPLVVKKKLTALEGETINLKETVEDPDGDPLIFQFTNPINKDGSWTPSYNDAGEKIIEFTVNDGEKTTEVRVSVTVKDKNQPPLIEDIDVDTKVKEGDKLEFTVNAIDNDNDELTHQWKFDSVVVSTEKEDELELDYQSSGTHLLELVISDGVNIVSDSWEIEVKDRNRRPQLSLTPITVKEGEEITLSLPREDLDGDELTYEFDDKFEDNTWQTTFDDAGEYEIEVTASDGELEITKDLEITVIDVDRKPEITVPENVHVYETETLSLQIKSTDPDGDKVTIKVHNAPNGAILRDNKLTWYADYNAIKRNGGMISNLLNSLRIEQFLLRKKVIVLNVESCGKDLCEQKEIPLVVYNVNRKPVLEPLDDITITEKEKIEFNPVASDPDEDIIHYSYSSPVDKFTGTWKPSYDDEGTHIIYVSATDGEYTDTKPVTVKVLKKNREPQLTTVKDSYIINEGQEVLFNLEATDQDQDSLTITLENVPPGASFNEGVFKWTPDKGIVDNRSSKIIEQILQRSQFFLREFSEDKEVLWLKFVASDGELEAVHPVKLTVKNVNEPPRILDFVPAMNYTAQVGEAVVFHVAVTDQDNDLLEFEWDFGLGNGGVKGTSSIERTFTTPGKKEVKVTVDDGLEKVEKVWHVNVQGQQYVQQALPQVHTFKTYIIEG